MTASMASQYEKVGNRIAQYMKSLQPGDESLQEKLGSFFKKYEKAPLVRVGSEESVYAEWLRNPNPERLELSLPVQQWFWSFRADFCRKAQTRKSNSVIIYVDTVGEDLFI